MVASRLVDVDLDLRAALDELQTTLTRGAHAEDFSPHPALRQLCSELAEAPPELLGRFTQAGAHLAPALRTLSHAHGKLGKTQRRDLRAAVGALRSLLEALRVNDPQHEALLRLRHVRVDLASLMARVCHPFLALAAERRVALTVTAPSDLVAELDPLKIERVLSNLLFNAFKYTPTGGSVGCTLALEPQEDTVEIRVADSGPGVPTAHREAIFERSRVLDRGGRMKGAEAGLSLADSRCAVELHGGRLTVGGGDEGGAIFVVELPHRAPLGVVVASEPPAPSTVAETVADLARRELEAENALLVGGGCDTGKPLVLIVEDSRSVQRILVDCLGEDFATASAFDGVEGLQLAVKLRPNLVIADIVMPNLDGERMLAAIRRHPGLDAVPVLILTAKEDIHERVELLSRGAQDFLGKPFFVEEVRARVSNLVAQKRAHDILSAESQGRGADLVTLAQEVSRQQRELRDAFDGAEIARDLAERASRVKTNFLRMMSHELRTPMTAMHLQLRLLESEEQGLTPRQRELIERQRRSLDRLLQIMEAVLQYSRIEDGRFRGEASAIDLTALVGEVIDELRPLAERKGLTLRSYASPGLAALQSDARLVRLIASNLVSGALTTVDDGFVQLSAGRRDGRHLLEVSDSGPGLSPAEQAEILEPLQRFDDVRQSRGVGSGLGLAMVKEMVRALGGELAVASVAGGGTTFSVLLPSLPQAVGP